MSNLDINAIRQRVNAATPGPWRADDTEIYTEDLALIADDRHWVGEVMKDDLDATRADSEFIAHARQDIPALLDVVEAVNAIHQPRTNSVGHEWCKGCGTFWPCTTNKALNPERAAAR